MASTSTTDSLREYRIERYQEMQFTDKEAARLADAKWNNESLDFRRVKNALEKGCGHKTALKIFT